IWNVWFRRLTLRSATGTAQRAVPTKDSVKMRPVVERKLPERLRFSQKLSTKVLPDGHYSDYGLRKSQFFYDIRRNSAAFCRVLPFGLRLSDPQAEPKESRNIRNYPECWPLKLTETGRSRAKAGETGRKRFSRVGTNRFFHSGGKLRSDQYVKERFSE